ncbi:hypothetical protein LDG_6221 [Legionella drancourtii LLAP12]|uniref:Uncharacterized protein n=1 Tax=Legionella drancourtii LLAP12 TaxID=658187 RepID=G9ELW1_9GAMM|nr:hypothetical protein LDG_6221 [Legionella drancourtii LLAP12]
MRIIYHAENLIANHKFRSFYLVMNHKFKLFIGCEINL